MKNGYFLSLLGKHKCFYYTTCYSSSGSTSIRQLRTLLFSSLVYPSRSEWLPEGYHLYLNGEPRAGFGASESLITRRRDDDRSRWTYTELAWLLTYLRQRLVLLSLSLYFLLTQGISISLCLLPPGSENKFLVEEAFLFKIKRHRLHLRSTLRNSIISLKANICSRSRRYCRSNRPKNLFNLNIIRRRMYVKWAENRRNYTCLELMWWI